MTEAEMIAKGKILYEVLRNVMKGAFTLMVPVGAFKLNPTIRRCVPIACCPDHPSKMLSTIRSVCLCIQPSG